MRQSCAKKSSTKGIALFRSERSLVSCFVPFNIHSAEHSVVPGGGVEPPRAEARRILSPLRLPVPPSRLIQLICWRQNHLLDRRRFCEVSVSHSPRTAANRCLAAYSADVGRDNWERL